jgi:hypothetical protein
MGRGAGISDVTALVNDGAYQTANIRGAVLAESFAVLRALASGRSLETVRTQALEGEFLDKLRIEFYSDPAQAVFKALAEG